MDFKSAREQAKISLESIAFAADDIWGPPSEYQQLCKKLYLRQLKLNASLRPHLPPTSAKDLIPESRLVKYNNFMYNRSREMSYARDNVCVMEEVAHKDEDLPWSNPEVDKLFKYYTTNKTVGDGVVNFEFESPLMNVNNLQEYLLKIKVTSNQAKKVWESEPCYKPSDYGNIISKKLNPVTKTEEPTNKLFEKQTFPFQHSNSFPETLQPRRTYSAVLQGPSKEDSTIQPKKPQVPKFSPEDDKYEMLFPKICRPTRLLSSTVLRSHSCKVLKKPLLMNSCKYQQHKKQSSGLKEVRLPDLKKERLRKTNVDCWTSLGSTPMKNSPSSNVVTDSDTLSKLESLVAEMISSILEVNPEEIRRSLRVNNWKNKETM